MHQTKVWYALEDLEADLVEVLRMEDGTPLARVLRLTLVSVRWGRQERQR